MKLRIFYSWQDTTDNKYNRNFISDAIEKAVKAVKKKPEFKGVDFEIQEGVKRLPGSPPVAATIMDDRIPQCDIFIADLSVVNRATTKSGTAIEWINKKLGNRFKPYQNNNVIAEYGIAFNAIGVERIIGVLNNTFGSPKDNPSNIPFDLSYLRFPIEYEYSEKTKQNKDVSKNGLVNDLTAAIKESAIYALQNQKSRYYPFIVWSDWEKTTVIKENYVRNSKSTEVAKQVLQSCQDNSPSVRILGLSGLGKTRILFETFRPDDSQESILLSSRVLYVNANDHPRTDFEEIFTRLMAGNEDRIVIIDNCDKSLHRQLLKFVRKEIRISLITINSNPEEIERDKIEDVNYIQIKKEHLSEVVDEILNRDFSSLSQDELARIKEFSQGIPLMAVLLGESVKKGEKFIGRLDNRELLDRLLGPKGQEEKNRKILKSCSLFNFIGYFDDFASQLEFIAKNKNITSLDGDDQVLTNDFREVCEHYLKREIFEKRGRFISMRPFPLAISLAQEWLTPITSKRLTTLITDIAGLPEPDRASLSESLAEQMKYLGYDDKAQQIIESITGPDSPFDDAEVLNTELGSRLFRAFVEVNPIAVSNNLSRQFGTKPINDIFKIVDGRRNLVWVLEKLCFDKRTFAQAVKVLYKFAVAENETWANNATGQFLHLFNVVLPGTEANLKDRWKIIEWGLTQDDRRFNELALRAMKVAIHFGHFSRSGGAEQQGSKTLIDYQPTWAEIWDYWNLVLQKLASLITSGSEFSKQAEQGITGNIRSIVRANQAQIIIPYIEELVKFKSNDWDECLEALKLAKKYDRGHFSEEQLAQVNKLITSLTKTDFISRYSKLSKTYHLETDESYSSDKVIQAMMDLADEFIQTGVSWTDSFPIFYGNQQIFSHHFGKRLYQIVGVNRDLTTQFIDKSLAVITDIPKEKRDVSVLGGFVTQSDEQLKADFYQRLSASPDLFYLVFYFISIDKEGKQHFNLLFDLVDSGRSPLGDFRVMRHSNSIQYMEDAELNTFSEKLFKYGKEGYEIVFDILFGIWFNDEKKKEILYPLLKVCIYQIGINRSEITQLDHYQWFHVIADILRNPEEKDFARFINKSVIDSITWENSYHLDHDLQNVYRELVGKHFDEIWKDLSDALLSTEEKYIIFYGLKHILGSHIGGIGPTIGILFDGNTESIFKWAKDNSPLAPARLAELVPIFDESEPNKWHPIALRLIDEFGEIPDVIRNLSANMGTFSWTGSMVPLLESKKELYRSLLDHPKDYARDWAIANFNHVDKSIENEKNRDEESFLI